jgi:tetratricopeptide (TPR) repeat protein
MQRFSKSIPKKCIRHKVLKTMIRRNQNTTNNHRWGDSARSDRGWLLPGALLLAMVLVMVGCKTSEPVTTQIDAETATNSRATQQQRSSASVAEAARADSARAAMLTELREMIEDDFRNKASFAIDRLVKAQEFFFDEQYRAALNAVMESLYVLPTADANALAGAIYFSFGEIDKANEHWQIAYDMNPEVVNMPYPGLEQWNQNRLRGML